MWPDLCLDKECVSPQGPAIVRDRHPCASRSESILKPVTTFVTAASQDDCVCSVQGDLRTVRGQTQQPTGLSAACKGVLLAHMLLSAATNFKIGIVDTKSRFLGPREKSEDSATCSPHSHRGDDRPERREAAAPFNRQITRKGRNWGV